MNEREITYTRDERTGAWYGWLVPDWQALRDRLDAQPEPTEQERIEAGARYALAAYNGRRRR